MIPNLLWKAKIPDNLPDSMQIAVDKLKKSKNKEDCLRKAYGVVSKRFFGCSVFRMIPDIFTSDVNILWSRKMSHCTNLNYLLRILLVKSGFFKNEGIMLKLTLIGYVSVHQYLRIKLDKDRLVNVDMWGASHGVKLGDYAHGFHYSLFRKIPTKLKNLIHF